MSDDSSCDTITSNVEIHYTGDPVTTSDQEEMFAVLIATIKAQAASGDFSEIGTIENVELSSEITTTNGNGLNVAKTAGIPAGVVGAFLVIVGGIVIGYCMMRGNGDDDEPNASNNVNTEQRGDVVEAEAIAVIDEEEEKDSKWKFNPSKFL
jgi:tetrahydromethanopterin S-methyltransferase subunit F